MNIGQNSATPRLSWRELPDLAISKIFEQLDSNDALRCQAVCRGWRDQLTTSESITNRIRRQFNRDAGQLSGMTPMVLRELENTLNAATCALRRPRVALTATASISCFDSQSLRTMVGTQWGDDHLMQASRGDVLRSIIACEEEFTTGLSLVNDFGVGILFPYHPSDGVCTFFNAANETNFGKIAGPPNGLDTLSWPGCAAFSDRQHSLAVITAAGDIAFVSAPIVGQHARLVLPRAFLESEGLTAETIDFGANGTSLMVGCAAGNALLIFPRREDRVVKLSTGSSYSIVSQAMSKDGQSVFGLTRGGGIFCWSLCEAGWVASNKLREEDDNHPDNDDPQCWPALWIRKHREITAHSGGRYLSFFDSWKEIGQIFDLEQLSRPPLDLRVGVEDVQIRNLCFHPKQDLVIGACSDNLVRAWNISQPQNVSFSFAETPIAWNPSFFSNNLGELGLWRAWFDQDGARIFTNGLARYGQSKKFCEEFFRVRQIGNRPRSMPAWGWIPPPLRYSPLS